MLLIKHGPPTSVVLATAILSVAAVMIVITFVIELILSERTVMLCLSDLPLGFALTLFVHVNLAVQCALSCLIAIKGHDPGLPSDRAAAGAPDCWQQRVSCLRSWCRAQVDATRCPRSRSRPPAALCCRWRSVSCSNRVRHHGLYNVDVQAAPVRAVHYILMVDLALLLIRDLVRRRGDLCTRVHVLVAGYDLSHRISSRARRGSA